jgi:hypothetical protein
MLINNKTTNDPDIVSSSLSPSSSSTCSSTSPSSSANSNHSSSNVDNNYQLWLKTGQTDPLIPLTGSH